MLSNLAYHYNQLLQRRPFLVQSLTISALLSAGDALSQSIEIFQSKKKETKQDGSSPQKYDVGRTLRMASWGCVAGPLLYSWYSLLDKLIRKSSSSIATPIPSSKFNWQNLLNAGKKMVVDQTVVAPLSIVVFFSYMGKIEGHSFEHVKLKLKADGWNALLANWAVWPAVQLLNFALLPPHLQAILVSFVGIFWNAYLSHLQHSSAFELSSKQ